MSNYDQYIKEMTLDEKASLLSGANFWNSKAIKRLGIPSIILTDGPHGLRRQVGKADHLGLNQSIPATCFPTAAALATSWDKGLLEQVGTAIGAEAAANGVSALLGPGINIVRDPLAGRAFEYFSEDPYITGTLASAMVKGIQSNGIAATPKHFAVNSQEHMRMSIDEVVDERTMRELYLEAFRRVVQDAKPKLLMTSYNKVNGTYANENTHLLQDILKNEWQYSGAIVTDWGGNNDRVAGLYAGSTLEMPSSNGTTDKEIVEAVKNGLLAESVVDEQVGKFLKLVFETTEAIKRAPSVNYEVHHSLAVEAAEKSMVLLKNEHNFLPIKPNTRVALIGDFADVPRYQGSGSSLVNPTRLVSALEAFREDDAVELVGYEPGFKRTGGKSAALIRKAAALAERAETVIVFLGLDEIKEAEGIDRDTMKLPDNQLLLLEKIQAIHENVVVVISAGSVIELPFDDDIAALIHGSLTGQGTGTAIANLITGRYNPSGKLAVTYPYSYSDTPTARYFPGKESTAEHREGLYVGYRYYETAKVAVRYPFGYGLSYTSFAYSDIVASKTKVTFSITNNGDRSGTEIAQVYINPPTSNIFRPARELKGYARVTLQPGETRQVTVLFDDHAFAHYNQAAGGWVVAPGRYTVEVGASVRDVRLQSTVLFEGDQVPSNYDLSKLAEYFSGEIKNVSQEAFETLLGRPLLPALWDRKAKLSYDDTVAQLQYGNIRGRLFYWLLRSVRRTLILFGKPHIANTVVFIMNLPISKISNFAGGKISKRSIIRLFGLSK
jgi:beta-glucosidase